MKSSRTTIEYEMQTALLFLAACDKVPAPEPPNKEGMIGSISTKPSKVLGMIELAKRKDEAPIDSPQPRIACVFSLTASWTSSWSKHSEMVLATPSPMTSQPISSDGIRGSGLWSWESP